MHLVVDLKFFFIEFFEESAIIETQSVYHSQNTDLQTSVWIKLLFAMGQKSWKQIGLQRLLFISITTLNMKTCLSRCFCHAAFLAIYTAIQLRKVQWFRGNFQYELGLFAAVSSIYLVLLLCGKQKCNVGKTKAMLFCIGICFLCSVPQKKSLTGLRIKAWISIPRGGKQIEHVINRLNLLRGIADERFSRV